jgi:anti-sigma factor RsiW
VTGTTDISCRELVEVITDYLEGAMTQEQRARFEAHLDGCEGCTRVVEQFRTTVALTGRLREEHLSDAERKALLAVFRSWSHERDADR